ncbi:MAG: PrsW family glutamic-type intramembrane protease [Clostridiales bacterium]
MTYIESVFICLTAPMLVGAICAGRKYCRAFVFVIAGYVACLLAAYINSFFARFYGADIVAAAVEIAPVVEEILKLLPLVFYILIFEPKTKDAQMAIFTIAASFATFENACYLTEHGATQVLHLLMRGFGAGAMHIICGVLIGYGLIFIWKYPWLKLAGTFGLLCAAITYHAIFNLLVSAGGAMQTLGYLFPIVTVTIGIIIMRIMGYPQGPIYKEEKSEDFGATF